jgi:hypothetical protein
MKVDRQHAWHRFLDWCQACFFLSRPLSESGVMDANENDSKKKSASNLHTSVIEGLDIAIYFT